jgi:hypothetical protein
MSTSTSHEDSRVQAGPAPPDQPALRDSAGSAGEVLGTGDRVWREWMMLGLALAGLVSAMAVILALASLGGGHSRLTRALVLSLAAGAGSGVRAAARAGPSVSLQMVMKSGASRRSSLRTASTTAPRCRRTSRFVGGPGDGDSSSLRPDAPHVHLADAERERDRSRRLCQYPQQDRGDVHRPIKGWSVSVVLRCSVRSVLNGPHRIHARIRDRDRVEASSRSVGAFSSGRPATTNPANADAGHAARNPTGREHDEILIRAIAER